MAGFSFLGFDWHDIWRLQEPRPQGTYPRYWETRWDGIASLPRSIFNHYTPTYRILWQHWTSVCTSWQVDRLTGWQADSWRGLEQCTNMLDRSLMAVSTLGRSPRQVHLKPLHLNLLNFFSNGFGGALTVRLGWRGFMPSGKRPRIQQPFIRLGSSSLLRLCAREGSSIIKGVNPMTIWCPQRCFLYAADHFSALWSYRSSY
jgi:hypothetical protein